MKLQNHSTDAFFGTIDYRIRANRTSLLIRTPGDTFWAHYGQFFRKIGQKYGNFRQFFTEIDHSSWPKNPKF